MRWIILKDTLTSRGNKKRRKNQASNWVPDTGWGSFASAGYAKLAFMHGTNYTLKDKPDKKVIALFDRQANTKCPQALVGREG